MALVNLLHGIENFMGKVMPNKFKIEIHTNRQTPIVTDNPVLANADAQYIVIDDVMGNSSAILTVLKKLHEVNEKVNYFFIVVKDIKR